MSVIPRAKGVRRTIPISEAWGLGYTIETGRFIGVPKRERIHTLVLGMPGKGKSTLLLFWILQHLEMGEGVAVIDPHGDLATNVMKRVPKKRLKDVIYINPLTAKDGWVVTFNPFEAGNPWEEEQKKNMFCDCLHLLYPDAWGNRMEKILKNAIMANYEAVPGFNLAQLSVFISDDSYRAEVLKRVTNPQVRMFWTQSWPRMKKEWLTAVETKLTHFESPSLISMFSSSASSVDFRKAMDQGKIVIIHLPEGVWGRDVVNFLGSMFLTWFYLAGMSREDTPMEKRRPFYIYVDEAHNFITESLRNLLQSLRKYQVFITLVTQAIHDFPIQFRDSLPQLCDTLVSFRVGDKTAEVLERYFLTGNPRFHRSESPIQTLMNLEQFDFMCRTQLDGKPIIMALRINPPPPPTVNLKRTMKEAKRWGRKVDVGRYLKELESRKRKIPYPELSPVSLLTLAKILTYEGGVPEEKLIEDMRREHGFFPRSVGEALRSLGLSGKVELEFRAETVDGKKLGRERPFVRLTEEGWKILYPRLRGARAGGATHAAMIGRVMRWAWKTGWCPVLPDAVVEPEEARKTVKVALPGSQAEVEVELWPDIIIYPPSKEGEKTSETLWDPTKRFAVEVEVYPTHHPDRVLAHVYRMKELGLPVLLVFRDEADKAYIADLLRKRLGVEGTGDISGLLGTAWGVAATVFPPDLPLVTEDSLLYKWAWENLKDLHPEEHRRMVEANQRVLEERGLTPGEVPVPPVQGKEVGEILETLRPQARGGTPAPQVGGAPPPEPTPPQAPPQKPASSPGSGTGEAPTQKPVPPPPPSPEPVPPETGKEGGAGKEPPLEAAQAPPRAGEGGTLPKVWAPPRARARAPPGAPRRGRKPPPLDAVRERVRKLKGQGYVFRKTTRRGEEVLYAYDPASWKKLWVGKLTPELKEILQALGIQL